MESPYDMSVGPVGPITRQQNARDYLHDSKVPELFKGLLAGLMVQRPKDPLEYLDTKLEEVKMRGVDNINWETFVFDLHPTRDPQRCKLIQHGKTTAKSDDMPPYEEYRPSLFKLTEPSD